MAPTLGEQKPQVGDLIEIFRGGYQHWAIYVGNGYVVHLAPPSEFAGAGACKLMSVVYDTAVVKMEDLWTVVGTDRWRVNNLLDDEYEPRSASDIVCDAKELVDQTLCYSITGNNCEHFVTNLRYGKATSRQVRQVAVASGVGLLAVLGVVAAVSYFGGSKEKRSKH